MQLSDKVYNVLKYVTMIGLPAIATFYNILAGIWGFPFAEEVSKTIIAVVTLLGALLGISTANYNKDKEVK